MKMSSRTLGMLTGVAGLTIVIAIAIAFNVILANLYVRKDMTEEKLYELSAGTLDTLKNLETKITLKFFFNESNRDMQMREKLFAGRVDDLLDQYELAARGMVQIEKYDPKPDSDAEEWARKYGVHGRPMAHSPWSSLYMGLVASVEDRDEAIPFLEYSAENLLEYNITRMIMRVSNPKKPVAGVLSYLPVLGTPANPYSRTPQRPEQPWFSFWGLQQDYDLRQIQPGVDQIDDDIDALIIVHPKLPNATLYAIDQFLLRGGRILAFVDPLCTVEKRDPMMPPQMQLAPKASSLGNLLDAWGVSFSTGRTVADSEAFSSLRKSDNTVVDSFTFLSLVTNSLNATDTLTANLEFLVLVNAGAFDIAESNTTTVTRLITSSASSSLVSAMEASSGDPATIRRSFVSGQKQLDLAIRLHGRFKTAFPNGKPLPTDKDDHAEARVDTTDNSLKKSQRDSVVILVGDVDMLYNWYCVEEVRNPLGFPEIRIANNNINFFHNAVEQITGQPSLATVRTRGKIRRPFNRIVKLRQKAEERHREEMKHLMATKVQLEKRLQELPAQMGKDGLVIDPKLREEWARLEKQYAQTGERLRKVRRERDRDIERLGIWVKAVNILAMPLLVILAGIGVSVVRRLKTRKT